MTLLACWVLFPLVLGALALGCGLLLDRLSGARLPGVLIPGAGLALIVVVADLMTQLDSTAELAAPLVVVLAVAGIALGVPRLRGLRGRQLDRWALAAAGATFAAFAAPTVLSGDATFAGYMRIEDTATWAAITDRVMEHGHSLDGLAPGSYEAVLDLYLGDGYPTGSFLPWGIGSALTGQDLAWLMQPYMAFLAAMLALALYGLAGRLIASLPLRALAAFLGTQSALLFAYAHWGAIKELVAVWLLALLAALLMPVLRENRPAWSAMPIAIVVAATFSALSLGGGVWLLPPLLAALVIAMRVRGAESVAGQAIVVLVGAALLSIPAMLRASDFLGVAGDVLTAGSELGNLTEPLNGLQAFGIWPSGDFRTDPSSMAVTTALVIVVALAAAAGLAWAWARGAWEVLLYVGGAILSCIGIAAFGSPWTDAKALAVLSPALVFAAGAGAAATFEAGQRVLAAGAVILIAGGLLWSNALTYHEIDLAPRERLAELEEIGEQIDGEGPTLTNEYEFWSARHFLRDGDPESPAMLNRREPLLRNGDSLREGNVADVDGFDARSVLQYRTIVVRRSPRASRPPSSYRLIYHGHYYEAWQRRERPSLLESHAALGGAGEAEGVANCDELVGGAEGLGSGDRLAYVERPPTTTIDLSRTARPSGWQTEGGLLFPDGAGTAEARVELVKGGRYGIWLGGSFRGALKLAVDGRKVESARDQLNYSDGQFTPMGSAELQPGLHTFTLRFSDGDLRPGSGGDGVSPFGEQTGRPFAVGPLILSQTTAVSPVKLAKPSQAASLCGKSLDWIETIGPQG